MGSITAEAAKRQATLDTRLADAGPEDARSVDWAKSQGGRADGGKARLHLIPFHALKEVAGVLGFGADKYCENNWQKGMKWTRCYNSCQRHLGAWLEGEDNDPESGMPHLAHAATNIIFLMWYSKYRPEFDDRYKPPKRRPIIDGED